MDRIKEKATAGVKEADENPKATIKPPLKSETFVIV
jgi:hypothetical protein